MSPATQVVIDDENPWPGLGPFHEADQRFFNGRSAETAELRRLVLQAPVTVLFGASGLGKTSLVQAGLFPAVRREQFLPIYVRLDVQDRTAPLIEQVKLALHREIEAHRIEAPPLDGELLWQYLHRRGLEFWSERNQLLMPLFVFDQFEEVFTLGPENQAAITRLRIDLADLIENRIPAVLAESLSRNEELDTFLALDHQRYKMLLSFREEFLPQIEDWKGDLPSLMRSRLHLLPMSGEQAFEAVYATGSKLLDESLAGQIVRFVATTRDQTAGAGQKDSEQLSALELEPALLSLVCNGLNERRKAQKKARFDKGLLSEGTGQAIISDYYENAVSDLPEHVQRFLEEQLLTERGFRKSCDLDDAQRVHGVSKEQLDLLVNRRVIRIEPWRATARIELIHDLLTRVVREHRDRQRSLDAERREKETARQVELLQQRARRDHRRSIFSGTMAFLLLVAAILLGWEFKKADDARFMAIQARKHLVEAQLALDDVLKQKLTQQQLTSVETAIAAQPTKDSQLPNSAVAPTSSSSCPKQADNGQARVYLHIRSEGARAEAKTVGQQLAQNCFTIPGIQLVAIGPKSTQIRYFRPVDEKEARRAKEVIDKALSAQVDVRYVEGYENSPNVRPGQLELWFAPT